MVKGTGHKNLQNNEIKGCPIAAPIDCHKGTSYQDQQNANIFGAKGHQFGYFSILVFLNWLFLTFNVERRPNGLEEGCLSRKPFSCEFTVIQSTIEQIDIENFERNFGLLRKFFFGTMIRMFKKARRMIRLISLNSSNS